MKNLFIIIVLLFVVITNAYTSVSVYSLTVYPRELTKEEQQYFFNDEYRKMFNIPKKIDGVEFKPHTKDTLVSDIYSDIKNVATVINLDALNCDAIKGKKFDENNADFFLCPLKNFKLDKKRLALLGGGSSEKYLSTDPSSAKEVDNIIKKSCSYSKNEYGSPYLYFKKANFCDDNNKINNIKKALTTYTAFYKIELGNSIVPETHNPNIKEYDAIESIDAGFSYYIIVDKSGDYMVLDKYEYAELYGYSV